MLRALRTLIHIDRLTDTVISDVLEESRFLPTHCVSLLDKSCRSVDFEELGNKSFYLLGFGKGKL